MFIFSLYRPGDAAFRVVRERDSARPCCAVCRQPHNNKLTVTTKGCGKCGGTVHEHCAEPRMENVDSRVLLPKGATYWTVYSIWQCKACSSWD